MPKVEYSFPEVISLLGRDYSCEELEKRIPMLGVDLEKIDSATIAMEVFPNRTDMLSVEGFVRALKGFLGLEKGLQAIAPEPSGIALSVDPSVSEVRPCVVAAVVRGMEFDDDKLRSLMDLQEKLHITHGRRRKRVAIGVHDISKVAPPFKYKAVAPKEKSFVPLDTSEPMDLQEILEKHPKGRDYAWTLEGAKKYPLIVDKNDDVLSFPPIINGELTRVTEETTDLFIDVTGTNQTAVERALSILTYALADRGGKIYSVELKTPSTRGA